jgi:hypothetical protein
MARKTGELPGKAGMKSLSRKLDSSRHGYNQHPGTSKTAGAFGKEEHMRAHESATGSIRDARTKSFGRMKRS